MCKRSTRCRILGMQQSGSQKVEAFSHDTAVP